ncbi:MAG: hypothetical protein BWY09_02702 [Candidatus Hydrogenedentes bacterium ADurb.Bin179]|nr:MAG: hypothetical protein BWY09_02702 [Candidatus Hydrogenedentes bacterium ADurb.Bin179]
MASPPCFAISFASSARAAFNACASAVAPSFLMFPPRPLPMPSRNRSASKFMRACFSLSFAFFIRSSSSPYCPHSSAGRNPAHHKTANPATMSGACVSAIRMKDSTSRAAHVAGGLRRGSFGTSTAAAGFAFLLIAFSFWQ